MSSSIKLWFYIKKCKKLDNNVLLDTLKTLKIDLDRVESILQLRYAEYDSGKMPYHKFNDLICVTQDKLTLIEKKINAINNILSSRGVLV